MTRFRGSYLGFLFQIFTIWSLLIFTTARSTTISQCFAVCNMNVDLFTVRIGLPIDRIYLLPKNAFINISFA